MDMKQLTNPGIRKTISSSNQPPMLKTLKNQRASSESLLQRVQGDNESRALSLRCGEFTMELSLAPLTEDDPRFTTKSKKVLLVATLKKTVVDASKATSTVGVADVVARLMIHDNVPEDSFTPKTMRLPHETPIVRSSTADTITLVWELQEENVQTMGFTLCAWTNAHSQAAQSQFPPLKINAASVMLNHKLPSIDGWVVSSTQRAYDFGVPVNTCRHIVHEHKKSERQSPLAGSGLGARNKRTSPLSL
eukprot:m.261501 g.261501  ORF g.261501 m.261501 type:complete len:249 (-) comp42278_c0_seq1:180-926(-)